MHRPLQEVPIMRKTVILTLLLCIACSVECIRADTIRIEADSWCPYNCEPNSASPGYMIEVMDTIFREKGHTIRYANTLWSRALHRVRKGHTDAVVGVSKREASQLIFPEEELGFSITVFFTRRDNPWEYAGTNSLKNIKIGIQKDYDYGANIQAYIDKYKKTDKVQVALDGMTLFPLQLNIKKLMKGEIDAIPEDKNVFLYTAQQMGYLNKVRYAGSEKSVYIGPENNNVYIAFSPENVKSKEYSNILTTGIRELRQNGKLKIILEKYGLSDWK